MNLSPVNKAVHERVWLEAVPLRLGYWQALDRLLDAVREEARIATLKEAAEYATFYAEERMRLCGDAILHDPVLAGERTTEAFARSREAQVDGTINSAGYHAANHIAEHLLQLALTTGERT